MHLPPSEPPLSSSATASMPTLDFIEVRSFVDGAEAAEYEEYGAVDEDNKCMRFIETKPGQRFSVKVTWLPGFRLRWAKALRCKVEKDEERFYDQRGLLPCDVQQHQGTLLESASVELSSTVFKDELTGNDMECEWAFEGVELSKSNLRLMLTLLMHTSRRN